MATTVTLALAAALYAFVDRPVEHIRRLLRTSRVVTGALGPVSARRVAV